MKEVYPGWASKKRQKALGRGYVPRCLEQGSCLDRFKKNWMREWIRQTIAEGQTKSTIGNQTCVLEEEESISSDSSIPHRWRNVGDTDVHVVWAITPPTL
ncbi:MAG: cupin domain-containing protein [Thermodesulfobacteriota bacterium]|nr:cupin domain-containing protein [Thermodesulfobacteriota bacterium]